MSSSRVRTVLVTGALMTGAAAGAAGHRQRGASGSGGGTPTRPPPGTRPRSATAPGDPAHRRRRPGAKQAALAAVPGATVIRVETDAQGSAYEVHMRKADGSLVTVKLNSLVQGHRHRRRLRRPAAAGRSGLTGFPGPARFGGPGRGCRRQQQPEHGAAALAVGRLHAAAVGFDDGGRDRQAEAGAAAGPRARRIGAVEPLEHAVGALSGQPGAAIGHLDRDLVAAALDRQRRSAYRPACAGGRWPAG